MNRQHILFPIWAPCGLFVGSRAMAEYGLIVPLTWSAFWPDCSVAIKCTSLVHVWPPEACLWEWSCPGFQNRGRVQGHQACRPGLVRGQCTYIRFPDRQGFRILEAFSASATRHGSLGPPQSEMSKPIGVDVTHISGAVCSVSCLGQRQESAHLQITLDAGRVATDLPRAKSDSK